MIPTSHLFLPLHRELIALLRGLPPGAWHEPTVAGRWRVKEVASHLLDGMLRRLSAARDGHQLPPSAPIDSPRALAAFVDGLNASWIEATARLSPAILIGLLEPAGEQLAEYFAGLDPQGDALWPVSWAGEESSRNWMDVGRDYTEQWHHQQQIRLATGRPLQLDRRFGYPALSLFVHALKPAYQDTAAQLDAEVEIRISGDAGGIYTLRRGESSWSLAEEPAVTPEAAVEIAGADAWLLFTKGLRGDAARDAVKATGPAALTAPFLRTVAIIG